MVIGTFGSTTAWKGRTITYDGRAFLLEGHGPITPLDVLNYARQGHLHWASPETEGMVRAMGSANIPAQPLVAQPLTARPLAQTADPQRVATSKGKRAPGTAVIIISAVAIVLIVGVVSCGACLNSLETHSDSSPSATLTADELISAYDANEVAADRQYKNKTVRITGVVSDIGVEIMDDAYVMLGSEETLISDIQCVFNDDYKDDVGRLSKGDSITVVGQVQGRFGWVLMGDCRLE